MRYFLLLCMLMLASCSRKSAEQLYSEGTSAEDKKQYTEAIDRYTEIVDKYENTAVADSALYRSAVVYNNDLHETLKAILAYEKYHEKYAASPRASTALFLAAFLWNNELHQLDSAKAAYERFLALYPQHELAQSARFELANLGKSPEEFTPERSGNQIADTSSSHVALSK